MEVTNNDDPQSTSGTQASGGWLPGFKMMFLPGTCLLTVLALPMVGWQLPGSVAGYPIHTLVAIGAALLVMLTAPFIWRAGFRRAGDTVGEESSIATRELNKQLHEARYQQQRRSKELDATLKKLKASENEKNALSSQSRRNQAISTTLVNATDEAVIITDIHGVIRGMSAPASQLCGVHRNDALESAFDAIVQLSDPSAERPEHHPVRRIALRAVDAPNAAPHLENCLLTDRLGNTTPVMVSSVAMTDQDGTAIGAYIRLDREDSDSALNRIPSQMDPVTGLTTRDTFTRRLDDLQLEARMESTSHQMLLIAADNLDFVSDRHGYLAAEQMLWQIGEICRLTTSTVGQCYAVSAGRIGVLMPDTDIGTAEAMADTIRQKLQQTTINWKNEHIDLPVTIAPISIDSTSPSVSGVLEIAESLIRAGRRAGGNRVYRGMPQHTPKDERFDDRGWAEWLQQRLGGGLGHLMSQEILPVNESAHKPGIECYLRVEDTDGVWISPNSFLPALRRTGETAMMDLWVLDQILEQLDSNPKLINQYSSISMNVAAESLQNNVFALRVSERLHRNLALAQQVRFEITENTATSLIRETTQFVANVQKAGASVAIDQARGLGLQQLLQSCSPNAVKIDHSLVRASQKDDLAAAQLNWLVESAHLRNVHVVACGVEQESWQKPLINYGVDFLQGSSLNKIGPVVI